MNFSMVSLRTCLVHWSPAQRRGPLDRFPIFRCPSAHDPLSPRGAPLRLDAGVGEGSPLLSSGRYTVHFARWRMDHLFSIELTAPSLVLDQVRASADILQTMPRFFSRRKYNGVRTLSSSSDRDRKMNLDLIEVPGVLVKF